MKSHSSVEAQASSGDAFTPLINGVRVQYPLITDAESALPYLAGDLHHASIRIRPNTHPKGIVNEVLDEALLRASEPSSVAYSQHGARGHSTYEESLRLLRDALGDNSLSLHPKTIFPTTRDGRNIPSERILVVAPQRERTTFVPRLQLGAESALQTARNNPNPTRVLYEAIQSTAVRAGIGPALMQAIFQEMHPALLEQVFADSSKRRSLTGDPGVIPHPKMTQPQREEYYAVAAQVNDALTARVNGKVQTRIDSGAHNRALEILGNNGWLRDHKVLRDEIGFEPTVRRVIPLAVFLTPHEIAARAANADHLEPYLSNALDRILGDQMTTQLITSFLKH